MTTWTHSKLGEFEFVGDGWMCEFEHPKFSVLNGSRSVRLMFEVNDENDVPSEKNILIASNTLSNIETLLDEGVNVLFRDFHGQGPDSGMWWHDDIDYVQEILSDYSSSLTTADDLYTLLSTPSIVVQETGYGYDNPCAIIGFESPIEEEHGIGLLTDGQKILGTGYRMGVEVFE